jgi:hypothetical protein
VSAICATQVLDKALAKEFEQDTLDAESGKGKTFNETVAKEEVRALVLLSSSASGSFGPQAGGQAARRDSSHW